jgi:hypothetical protein
MKIQEAVPVFQVYQIKIQELAMRVYNQIYNGVS